MPLWHVNYFELKAVETLRAQEKLYISFKEFKLGALPSEEFLAEIAFDELSAGQDELPSPEHLSFS